MNALHAMANPNRVIDFPKLVKRHPVEVLEPLKADMALWLEKNQAMLVAHFEKDKKYDLPSIYARHIRELSKTTELELIQWFKDAFGLLLTFRDSDNYQDGYQYRYSLEVVDDTPAPPPPYEEPQT